MKRAVTFEEWLTLIDRFITQKTGIGREDLPDCRYRDWFDDGVSAKNAAARAIRHAKED